MSTPRKARTRRLTTQATALSFHPLNGAGLPGPADKSIATQDEQAVQERVLPTTTTSAVKAVEAETRLGINPKTRIKALAVALRPKQWTKNLAVFIGLVFSQRLFSLLSFERTVLACSIFCLVSSSIYLLNDLLDLENDRQHPVKRERPLASGLLPVSWAITAIVIFLASSALLTSVLFTAALQPQQDILSALGGANLLFTATILCYFVLMVFYSLRLKHIVLIDVFVIASGFILRILAGTVVVPVLTSPWLYMVTCFLSLFLALGKRRNELVLLQQQAGQHRQILKDYTIPMLDQMITITVTATIIAYSLYTIEGPLESRGLMITIPLVLYGIFRYLYLVYIRMDGGSPEEVLLRDRHMLGTVTLCTAMIIVVLYLLPHILLR